MKKIPCAKPKYAKPNWKVDLMAITKLDANGRVQLPLGIRFRLDLNAGDKLAIDQLGDGTIIIKKPALKMAATWPR